MCELKVYTQDEILDSSIGDDVYLQPDVDKILAEKDKKIAELKDDVTYWKKVAKKNMDDNVVMAKQRVEAFKRERHQKYKQCLAMASKCRLRARWFGDMDFYKKEQWALKWHRRWLELAEKFKEAE